MYPRRFQPEPAFSVYFRRLVQHGLLALLLATLSVPGLAMEASAPILVVHSYSQDYPWTAGQHRGFSEALAEHGVDPATLRTEYLDTKRVEFSPLYADWFAQYLAGKYAGFQPRLIYVTDDHALTFALDHLLALFPGSSVIFSGVNDQGMRHWLDPNRITGVFEKKELRPNVALLRSLGMDTSELVLVGDNSSTYRSIRQSLRAEMEGEPGIKLTFVADERLDGLLQQLREIRAGPLLLTTLGELKDAEGHPINLRDSVARLAGLGRFTLWSMEDAYLYPQVMGGHVTSGPAAGHRAGEMAMAFLKGTPLASLPPVLESPNESILNETALHQAGMTMPPGYPDQIRRIHERPGILVQHQREILLGLAMLATLSLLVMLFGLITLVRKNRQIRQHAETLQHQTELLDETLNNLDWAQRIAQVGSWVWHIDRNRLSISKGVYELFGIPNQGGPARVDTYLRHVHPEDRRRVWRDIQRTRQSKKPYEGAHRIIRPDGSVRSLHIMAEVQKGSSGRPTRMYGSVQDITERLEAQAALLASEQTYHSIFDGVAEAIYILDEHGTFLDVNQGAETMYGMARSDLIGLSPAGVSAPGRNNLELTARALEAALAGVPQRFEFWGIRRNGEIFPKDVRLSKGSYFGREVVIAVAMDISEQKRAEDALRNSEALLQTVINEDPNIILMKDWEGRFIFCNQALAKLYGLTPDRLVGKDDGAFNPNAEQVQRYRDEIQEIMISGQTRVDMQESPDPSAKMGKRYLQFIKKPLHTAEGEHRILIIATDVTDIRLAQQQAEESERRLAYAMSAIGEGLWDLEALTGRIRHNSQWCRILGLMEYLPDHPLPDYFRRIHPDDRESVMRQLNDALVSDDIYQSEHRMLLEDGRVIWIRDRGRVVERDDQGQALRMVGSFTEITQRKEMENELKRLARHDTLTGLPNRAMLMDRMEHALAKARRHGSQMGVLFLDLDRFKQVNDTLGHQIGDKLLMAASGRLTTLVRSQDTVARLGGDEFVILLEDLEAPQDAAVLAKKIIQRLEQPFQVEGHELYVSASIGVGLYPQDGDTPQGLLRNADAAMYHAKDSGRSTFSYYTASLTEEVAERMEIEAILRQDLAQEQLRLHYQPIVDLTHGRLVGMEALLRCSSPQHGPDQFIPVAEDTGLIIPLGAWVIGEACRQGRLWLDQGRLVPGMRISINLSLKQLQHREFRDTLQRILGETGFPAEHLELELTESSLMQHPEESIALLGELGRLGLHVAVDDFGTGYSSLSYLKRLPIHRLKIDQSFVRDIPDDPNDESIVKAILALGSSLQFGVVAEGIETREQRALLEREGCRYGQGYLFGKPMAAQALEAWWSAQDN